MAKRIVAIYDRGIDKNLMQGFDVLEKYGYELTLVEKTVNEDELAYQNSMLSVEVNGPDGTPINEEVFQYLDDAEIIITHFAPVSRRMIEAAKNLKIIATLRTGMENINMEAAKERGIKVINAPGRAAVAVADFTVAAMLCEIRNIARTDEDIKTGGWTKKYPNRTYSDNMCNLKVGLVGFGAGIFAGTLFLKKGFSLKRSYDSVPLEGVVLPVSMTVILLLFLTVPVIFKLSEAGPGSKHAPVWLALALSMVIGALAQRSRLCMAGGVRDTVMLKDPHLLWGSVAIFVVVLVGNLIMGNFTAFSFLSQPIAHSNHIWNLLGMVIVGWGSVLLGGCPLRQLILAGSGNGDSAVTVFGMIVGAAFAHNFALAGNPDSTNDAGELVVGGIANAGKVAVAIGFVVLLAISLLNSRKEATKA